MAPTTPLRSMGSIQGECMFVKFSYNIHNLLFLLYLLPPVDFLLPCPCVLEPSQNTAYNASSPREQPTLLALLPALKTCVSLARTCRWTD